VKSPDSLADVVDPDEEVFETECMPGVNAWFAATGTEQDEGGYEAWAAACAAPAVGRCRRSRAWAASGTSTTTRPSAGGSPDLAALYLDRDE